MAAADSSDGGVESQSSPEEGHPLTAGKTNSQFLEGLPPLPSPTGSKWQQALVGFSTVLMMIIAAIVSVHVGSYLLNHYGFERASHVYIALVYVEACLALVCWTGLLIGKPCVVHRTEQTVFPVPAQVLEAFQDNKLSELTENVADGSRTYCVRCFVWRDPTRDSNAEKRPVERVCSFLDARGHPHHCSTCQQCVQYFDHHCGFFGRCITGRGMSGNIGYFKGLIGLGQVAGLTCGSCWFWALLQTKWGYWIAVVLGGYCLVTYTLIVLLALARLLQRVALSKMWRRNYAATTVQGEVIGRTQ